ncbi:PIN domain-containing protein [Pectobacterium brasiliense]|uniref:PIN domain-containing protein n=1 Tax=Pectobacterium brasiliense TaxID=180957 RepID=UPI0013747A05|nr:PIN domain-containing protein [Pectobacterium carotovorum]
MELQTRLVFLDTSAYQAKNFQFGFYDLARLEQMVAEEKIHLLVTDVIRSEIEAHIRKFADDTVSQLKKFQKAAAFLRVAEESTGGGLFVSVNAEAVFEEAMTKFRALMDNGLTEQVPVSIIEPAQIFRDYFSASPPFHREAKKSEFPDAFSLAAVDKVARERNHMVYIVSADGDMKAVADRNPNFIHLEKLGQLLDLVNRNDEELAALSGFADNVLQMLMATVLDNAQEILEEGEYIPSSSGNIDHDISDIEILDIDFAELQLIDLDTDGATYEVVFNVSLLATYDSVDYSKINWDREDRVMYGVQESSNTFRHHEQYAGTVEIGFFEGLKANAEVLEVKFEDSVFDLDLDEAEYVDTPSHPPVREQNDERTDDGE